MDRSNSRDTPEIKAEEGLHQKRNIKDGNRIRLVSMIFLTFFYFLVEIIVGYWTGSVALVADSFHMLSDVMSLVIAYLAVTMSPKDWTQNTFGWARAEVLGALVNGVFLAALCFSIVVEALERFIEEPKIKEPKLILIVGTVGLLVNLIGLALFHDHGHSHGGGSGGHGHGHSHGIPKRSSSKRQHIHNGSASTTGIVDGSDHKISLVGFIRPIKENGNLPEGTNCNKEVGNNNPAENELPDSVDKKKSSSRPGDAPPSRKNVSSASQMNMRGVFLHVLADALGSVIVMISALIIWLTDWKYKMYIDPVLSIVMVILILASVWPLLQESAMVLLQTVPTHIQIDELKQKILGQVPGALEVHEFHIWQLAGNRIIASAHILCNDQADYMRIGEQVKEIFHNEGIHSTTIQLEYASNRTDESSAHNKITSSDCFLTCPGDANGDCASNSCCGVRKRLASTVATNLAFISESPPSLGRNIA